jgi:beta-1,4-mannosyl-glycoprotein beta-1,4-N-acetylglucosaminyltransferase
LFDATFNNASVNRSATSSIVADAALPTLSIALGAPARISPSRSRVLLPVAPLRFSAVAIGRQSCTAASTTGTAFPCPPGPDPTRSTGITPPSGTTRSSDFCWAIESSSSRSPTYRPSPAGTQQISQGETLRFRRDRVATTPSTSTGIGTSPLRDGSPTKDALRHFTLVRHHDTPMASSRPALTEIPQRNGPHWDRPVNSGPRPCLVSVGLPLSGSRNRTSTSHLNTRTWHSRSIYDLAAIVAGQPRRDPQPESFKLRVPSQLARGPAVQRPGSRWHDDLFRSCLHTSWDRPSRSGDRYDAEAVRRVYDCFIVNDELDLLEARLKWLDAYVSYFVIVEATRTFSGHAKPLYFSEHTARFARWAEKIRVVVVDDLPSNGSDRWAAEVRQRNAAMEALADARPDDVAIISDVDEFVNRDVVACLQRGVTRLTGLELESTFYRGNWMVPMGAFSCAARALPVGRLVDPHEQRNRAAPEAIVRRAGTHFTYLLDADGVRRKFASYAHSEMDNEHGSSPAFIARAQRMGLDIFSRRLVTVRSLAELSPPQRHLRALHPELFSFASLPPRHRRVLFRWYAEWRVSTLAKARVVRELDERYELEQGRVFGYAALCWFVSHMVLYPRRLAWRAKKKVLRR